MSGYLGNAHGWATEKISKHPTGVALTLAVLILLVIILFITTMVYHSKWKKATPASFRSGFKGPNGSWTGGMHSNWQNGSVHDQNYFGPQFQHFSQLGSTYMPAVTSKNALRSAYKGKHHMQVAAHRAAIHRANAQRMKSRRLAAMHRREGQAVGPLGPGGMQPVGPLGPGGMQPVGPLGPGGMQMTTPDGGTTSNPSTCVSGTSPLATGTYDANGAPQYQCLTPDEEWGGDTTDSGYDWIFDPSACPTTGAYDPVTGVMTVDTTNIADVWDPDAIAEAQALASVGSYVSDPSGDEMAFQAAIGSAYSANAAANTMSDAQLSAIMAGGTAP